MPATLKIEKHTHKLKRLKYRSGNSVFFCVDNCSYKVSSQLALGKRAICWRCGEDFSMNEYSVRLVKPHCENCHKTKKEHHDAKEEYTGIESGTKEITETSPVPIILSLAERLNQTLQTAQVKSESEKTEEEGDI